MLIRLAPDMFVDRKFDCVTSAVVLKEIYQTQRFKDRYPWRNQYKSKIMTNTDLVALGKKFEMTLKAINNMIFSGTFNQKSNKCFDLSGADQTLAALAVSNEFDLCSIDVNLVQFLEQEFDCNNLSPLALYNNWLENKILKYLPEHAKIFTDWKTCREKPQPLSEIQRFNKLTGVSYLGS
ncbi:MAG: hypothetical protein HQM10_12225 [Candidatus Riflebacteria bacterium]|nr:hypothetical protein [Candidatus Riflebacteria bacterium]